MRLGGIQFNVPELTWLEEPVLTVGLYASSSKFSPAS
jgi:hypothetical protein